MSTPLDTAIARRARAIIADPAHWCRDFFVAYDNGSPLIFGDIESDAAKRFCAHGALMRAASEMIADPREADDIATGIVCRMIGAADPIAAQTLLWEFNATKGHAAVLGLLDRFIQGGES